MKQDNMFESDITNDYDYFLNMDHDFTEELPLV